MDRRLVFNHFEMDPGLTNSGYDIAFDRELLRKFIIDVYCLETNENIFFIFNNYDNIFKSIISDVTNGNKEYKVFKQGLAKNNVFLLSQKEAYKDEQINTNIQYIDDSKDKYIEYKYKFVEQYKPVITVISKTENHKNLESFIDFFIEYYKNSFCDELLKQNKGKYPHIYNFFHKVFKSFNIEHIIIPFLSIYYYDFKTLISYNHARKFFNNYIKNYENSGVLQYREYYKNYNTNHFFIWFYLRYYVNRTLEQHQMKDNIYKYYPRIKEAAVYGIVDKKRLNSDWNAAMFYGCVDIFQILNFTFEDFFRRNADIRGTPINATCYEFIKDIDSRAGIIDNFAKTIVYSDELKPYLIKNKDVGICNNELQILDNNDIDTILSPFQFFLLSQIKDLLPEFGLENIYNDIQLDDIFATENPNRRVFIDAVLRYNKNHEDNKSNFVLLLVKISNRIQIRFEEILKSDKKIVLLFYNDNNTQTNGYCTIDSSCMNMDNIRILFYDNYEKKIIPFYGDSKLNLDTTNTLVGKLTNQCNDNNINIKVSYYSYNKIMILQYKHSKFRFMNFDMDNKIGIAGIKLEGISNINTVYIDDANDRRCEINVYIHKKDKTLSEEYIDGIKCYMFVKDTEEVFCDIVELNKNISEKAKFNGKCIYRYNLNNLTSNSNLRFSFYKTAFIYTNVGKGSDKHMGAGSLPANFKNVEKYDIAIYYNYSHLPDLLYIKNVQPLFYDSRYLKAQINYEVTNTDMDIKDIESYFRWMYIYIYEQTRIDELNLDEADVLENIYNDSSIEENIISGRILDIDMESTFMGIINHTGSDGYSAVALIPYIDKKIPSSNYLKKKVYTKHAIILGHKESTNYMGVTSSISQIVNKDGSSFIQLEAFHMPYIDKPNISETKWAYLVSSDDGVFTNKNFILPNNNQDIPSTVSNIVDSSITLSYKQNKVSILPAKGNSITVHYREEWFNKKVIFFPYQNVIESNISETWDMSQPISLLFNGEKLKILHRYNMLKEYEARSGQMEKRNLATNNENVLTQHDEETVNDNQTQDNTTISLNMLDVNNDGDSKLKAVHYPGYSAGNTLNLEKDEKFYYDDKAKYRIEEGEYYIFANKITDYDGGSFIFRQNKINKVGNRYVRIHKNLQGDTTEFSAEDEKMLIHGGTNYEDNGGIDLSEYSEDFFKYLEYIVKEKYCDKLYKVAGNIPIRLIVKYGKSLSLEEARVRAFMRMIRVGEGTKGSRGYEIIVGGTLLEKHGKDFSQHPGIYIEKFNSTAAGAYQFLESTWRDYATKNGISDFSPINQDKVCVMLLKYKRHALDDIMAGNIRNAIQLCNEEWASLPGSPYGQRTETMESCLEYYNQYLEEELRGKTSLAVPIGDLDDLLFK